MPDQMSSAPMMNISILMKYGYRDFKRVADLRREEAIGKFVDLDLFIVDREFKHDRQLPLDRREELLIVGVDHLPAPPS